MKRAEEADFKAKMSEIAEEWNLYYTNLIINNEDTNIYAGKLLKEIIKNEALELEENKVKDITKMIKSVKSKQEKYVIIYEGKLYYVSQSSIKNNEQQIKCCEELGIRIWEYAGNTNTGIKVINGNRTIDEIYEEIKGIVLKEL